MTQKPKDLINRRNKKYIDRSTQGRIAIMVVTNALMYIFLLALMVFGPLAYRMNTNDISPELQDIANAFLALHEHFWPAILILLVIIGFHSIRVSHRMAGPVYRFKEVLKSVQKGDLTAHSILRKGDFFVDLMDEINRATTSMSKGYRELKETDGKLRAEISALNEKLKSNTLSSEALKQSASNIHQHEETLRQQLENFKLKNETG